MIFSKRCEKVAESASEMSKWFLSVLIEQIISLEMLRTVPVTGFNYRNVQHFRCPRTLNINKLLNKGFFLNRHYD